MSYALAHVVDPQIQQPMCSSSSPAKEIELRDDNHNHHHHHNNSSSCHLAVAHVEQSLASFVPPFVATTTINENPRTDSSAASHENSIAFPDNQQCRPTSSSSSSSISSCSPSPPQLPPVSEASLLHLHLELNMEEQTYWPTLVDEALTYCGSKWPENQKSTTKIKANKTASSSSSKIKGRSLCPSVADVVNQ